jgi:phage terminase large subunit-like protein
LYEAGRAHHVGAFPVLEDQLCGLITGGRYEGPGRSPDRADALVWAMSEAMLGRDGGRFRVRVV